jgi:hypothetical protein
VTRTPAFEYSFEIHWTESPCSRRRRTPRFKSPDWPRSFDLHWRGCLEFKDLPWTQPLTRIMPDAVTARLADHAERLRTRYGSVDESWHSATADWSR